MKRLTKLRENKDLTIRELASFLNISHTSLADYEKGLLLPNGKHLITISDFFSVSIDYLLERNLESPKEVCNIASYQGGKEDLSKVITDLEETIKVLRELQKKL